MDSQTIRILLNGEAVAITLAETSFSAGRRFDLALRVAGA